MMPQKVRHKTLWRMVSLVVSLASVNALYLRWLWSPDMTMTMIFLVELPFLMGWILIATWAYNEVWWTPKLQKIREEQEKRR